MESMDEDESEGAVIPSSLEKTVWEEAVRLRVMAYWDEQVKTLMQIVGDLPMLQAAFPHCGRPPLCLIWCDICILCMQIEKVCKSMQISHGSVSFCVDMPT